MIITVKYDTDFDSKLNKETIMFMNKLGFILIASHEAESGLGGCILTFGKEEPE